MYENASHSPFVAICTWQSPAKKSEVIHLGSVVNSNESPEFPSFVSQEEKIGKATAIATIIQLLFIIQVLDYEAKISDLRLNNKYFQCFFARINLIFTHKSTGTYCKSKILSCPSECPYNSDKP